MVDNIILKKTIEFSVEIVKYVGLLERQKNYVIARQILRAGAAIGANVHEAQNPESRADFVHKFKIAAKEADETRYWLILCQHSSGFPDCKHLLEKLTEIEKIITKIIFTSKKQKSKSDNDVLRH